MFPVFVSLSVAWLDATSLCKLAEWIEFLLLVETSIVFNGDNIVRQTAAIYGDAENVTLENTGTNCSWKTLDRKIR